MKKQLLFFIIIATVSLYSVKAQDKGKKISDKLLHNLVAVDGPSSGWGFVIGKRQKNLYVLTPNHVVRNKDEDIPGLILGVRFSNLGDVVQGFLIKDKWISEDEQDMALIRVPVPAEYRYHPGIFACTKRNLLDEKVWFLGVDGIWKITESSGTIKAIAPPKDKLTIEGFNDVSEGTSGAPIISEMGFEGMLLGKAEDGVDIDAVSLDFIEKKLKDWKFPYEGNKLKRSTYLYSTLSLVSVGSAMLFKQKKDDKYNVYSTSLDPTAPVYHDKTRDEYYDDAKKYQTLETSSYIIAGVFAGLAYLVNKKCWFVPKGHKNNGSETSINVVPIQNNNLTSVQLQLNLKY